MRRLLHKLALKTSCVALVASSIILTQGAAYAQSAPGVTKDSVLIGQSAALTGPASLSNTAQNAAANAYFEEINAKGGVNGRKILYKSLDDKYDAPTAVANVKTLIEQDKVFALFQVGGLPANMAIAPVVVEAKIPHLGPATGGDNLRMPPLANTYTFNTRASYGQELAKIAEHLQTVGLNKVVIAYSDQPFSKGAMALFEAAAKKRDLTIQAKVLVEEVEGGAEKAVKEVKAANGNAIVFVTAGKIALDFARQFKRESNVQAFTLSLLASPILLKSLGDNAVGFSISQAVPFPFSPSTPIGKSYLALMQKAKLQPSFVGMEGYINARLFVEALKRAGRNPTRESFMTALESFNKYDMGGYYINFNKNERNGSSFVEMTIIGTQGRFMK